MRNDNGVRFIISHFAFIIYFVKAIQIVQTSIRKLRFQQ